jgi:hypothetical protein
MSFTDHVSNQKEIGKFARAQPILLQTTPPIDLADGEELLWTDRPILLAYLYGGYDMFSIAALILGSLFLSIMTLYFIILEFPGYFLGFSLIPLLIILYQLFPVFKYLDYQNITYQITSKRVIITDSRVSSEKISIDLDQISKVSETSEKLEDQFKTKSVTITPRIHHSSLKDLHYTMVGLKKTANIVKLLKGKS